VSRLKPGGKIMISILNWCGNVGKHCYYIGYRSFLAAATGCIFLRYYV
jgi:hypothetical protein